MKTSFECSHCGRLFSRPSHRDRHRLTHLPPDRRHAIPCGKCGKTFGRHDVLLRHLRSAHQIVPESRESAQRSCDRCVQKRRKCDRALPCHACAAAGEVCEYPSSVARRRAESGTESAAILGRVEETPNNDEHDLLSAQSDIGTESATSVFTDIDTVTDMTPISVSAGASQAQGAFYGSSYDTEFDSVVPGAFGAMTDGSANSSLFLPSTDVYSPSFSDGEYYLPSDTPFGASLSAVGQLDFRAPGLDWLDFDVPSVVGNANEPSLLVGLEANSHVEPPSTSHSLSFPALGGRHPVRLPWPFDQAQDFIPHRCSLPPLREVLHSTLKSDGPIPSSTLESVVSLMSETRLPRLDELRDPNTVRAANLLKQLEDVYFSKFHPILPLLHAPTFAMSAFPTVLVAAMACIGGLLSDDDHAAELAWSMSEICMPMITWLGSSDTANYQDISYLSALCLHQIYSLGSGSRELYQNADRSRGILVGGLRGVGCLTTRLSVDDQGQDVNASIASTPSASLRDEWATWIARERVKRAAWAAFEYDCSLSTLTSRRGAVDLSELPRDLPCADSLWDAPSAQAWAALRARVHPNSFGVPVSSILKAVLPGNPVPKHVSFWSKRLCAQVIGRLLWDLKQLEVLSTAEYFGMPRLAVSQKENKAVLLRALDSLLASMNEPTSTADLISYNIASLICHYSHLYTAHDTLDIVLYIVRSAVSSAGSPKLDRGIQLAQRRLQSLFARDPRQARRLAWHAAQIAAVANDYLVSAPCEIMRLFMGYVFLVAFAKYAPRASGSGSGGGGGGGGSGQQPTPKAVRLDLPLHQVQSAGAASAWVEHGGPAAIGSVADIFADKAALAISCDARAMLQKLRCWGLAEKFSKILQSFESTVLVSSDA